MNIIENIKDIKFKGYESYDIEALFLWVSELDVSGKIAGTSKIRDSLSLLFLVFFDRYKYIYTESRRSKILFTIPLTLGRSSIIEMIKNVASLAQDYDLISYKKRIFPQFSFYAFKILFLILYWVRSLNKTKLSFNQKVVVLKCLTDISKLQKRIEKIDIKKYNLLTVFYDAAYLDNYLVQLFKTNNIKTATLQHGLVIAPRDEVKYNVEFSGVELRGSISDYFLAWNKLTKIEAIKVGFTEDKIKVLGIPYFVGIETIIEKPNNKMFGVVLSTLFSEKSNIELIEYANKLAQQIGYKYVLRYHPNFKGNEYDQYVDNNFFCGSSDKSTSIKEYASDVEFSLVSSSSVYMELIYLNHLVYRFSTGDVEDKYRDIPYLKFSNFDQLVALQSVKDSAHEQLFSLLCETRDVSHNYKSFFENFK